jgi:hypothetical protein
MTDEEKQEIQQAVIDALINDEWPEALSTRLTEFISNTISGLTKTLEDETEIPRVTTLAELQQVITLPAAKVDAMGMSYVQVPVGLIGRMLRQNMTATSAALSPGVLYKWGAVSSLQITLEDGTEGADNEYMLRFTVSGDQFTLTLPETIRWSEEPEWTAGTTYEVSIADGLALSAEWESNDKEE